MRIDNGMFARKLPDLEQYGSRPFKDRIMLIHHARDHVLDKTSFVVEELDTIPAVNAVSVRGINTVQLHKVFAPNTALLGFGMPNVFLAKVLDPSITSGDPVARFDAKSLYREKNKIIYRKNGNDQAGFYIVPNLAKNELDLVIKTAHAEVDKSYKTCSYAVSTILHLAGFTTESGKDIRRTWPTDLLELIVTEGLKLNGRQAQWKVLRMEAMVAS